MDLAIITGTTSGIGAALRDVLAADKNNFVITLSRAPGTTASPFNVSLDVSDLGAIESAFATVTAHIGDQHFDRAVLINNAGVVSPVGAFDQISAADTGHNLVVNVAAPMVLPIPARRSRTCSAARRRRRSST